MQLFDAVPGHVHPVPNIDTSVIPAGTVSVTVTVPLVGPAPAVLDTVTVYCAFCWPGVKLPLCVFEMLSTGGFTVITVESVVLAGADPPPDTETEFTCGVVVFAATFSVTVIAG